MYNISKEAMRKLLEDAAPIKMMNNSINALHFELPEVILNDVKRIWQEAFTYITSQLSAMEGEGEKVASVSLNIEFQDCWKFDDRLPESDRWLAILHSIPGMVITAPTKDEAFNQMIISLKVKAAYDSKYILPDVETQNRIWHELLLRIAMAKEVHITDDDTNYIMSKYIISRKATPTSAMPEAGGENDNELTKMGMAASEKSLAKDWVDDGQEGKGLRWVKIGERLPEDGDYYTRVINPRLEKIITRISIFQRGKWFIREAEQGERVTEWLDEMGLPNFLVMKDYDNHYSIWPKKRYEKYISGAVEVGAGSAYKIVVGFNGDEDFLFPSKPSPPPAMPEAGGIKWVNVSERLPKKEGYYHVNVLYDGGIYIGCSYFKNDKFIDDSDMYSYNGPTELKAFEWLEELPLILISNNISQNNFPTT